MRHKTMNVLRVAKVIQGTSKQAERLIREAHLLKDLKHPQIPTIYDIEKEECQDSEFNVSICIIEEYIDGKSLREYISEHTDSGYSLKLKDICRIGIELCNILEYLHDNENVQILHMDLKPDNIMICRDRVVLIDFDNAVIRREGQKVDSGSPLFAAPEQYERKEAVVQSDIYGLGMIIFYMAANGHISVSGGQNILDIPKCYSSLNHIIEKSIRHNTINRYRRIDTVRKELEKIINKRMDVSEDVSVVIKVAGLKRGIGATHTALCMAHFFEKSGYDCIVMESNDRDDMLCAATHSVLDSKGLYRSYGVRLLPDYKGGIRIEDVKCRVLIIDCGEYGRDAFNVQDSVIDSVTEIKKTSFNVLVTGKAVTKDELSLIDEAAPDCIMVNLMSAKRFYDFSKKMSDGKNCYRVPCIYEWYEDNPIFDESMKELLQDIIPAMWKQIKNNRFKEFVKQIYGNCNNVRFVQKHRN